VNFQALKQLVDKKMASGVPMIEKPDQVCESFLVSKETKLPFPYSTHWRADEPLGLVHVDLCGRITPSTQSGNRYFMLLVDDCTRWSSVYMLKSKDQVVQAFSSTRPELKMTVVRRSRC
jgi:hypothetical protein